MEIAGFQTRRADSSDVEAIAAAHRDSILSIGPAFYPPNVVADWQAGISRDLYLDAMERERGLLHCSRIAAGPADRPRLCDITERGWR